jgi:hypothetical protein
MSVGSGRRDAAQFMRIQHLSGVTAVSITLHGEISNPERRLASLFTDEWESGVKTQVEFHAQCGKFVEFRVAMVDKIKIRRFGSQGSCRTMEYMYPMTMTKAIHVFI